jgi:integrase
VAGSMRQRGHDSWQLRVYLGLNPGAGKQRWAARTVHGSPRYAQAQLALLLDGAQAARTHAGTVTDLLQRWFTAASPNWAVSTVRETRSLIRCHLDPHLGYLPVAKLTTADIDDVYAHLLRAGGRDARPPAPCTACTSCCIGS